MTTFTPATKSQNVVMACGATTLRSEAKDTTNPTVTLTAKTSTVNAESQTATLKCSD